MLGNPLKILISKLCQVRSPFGLLVRLVPLSNRAVSPFLVSHLSILLSIIAFNSYIREIVCTAFKEIHVKHLTAQGITLTINAQNMKIVSQSISDARNNLSFICCFVVNLPRLRKYFINNIDFCVQSSTPCQASRNESVSGFFPLTPEVKSVNTGQEPTLVSRRTLPTSNEINQVAAYNAKSVS